MFIFSSPIIFLTFLIYVVLLACVIAVIILNARKFDFLLFCAVAAIYIFLNLIRSGYGVDEPTYSLTYKEYIQSGRLDFEFAFNFLYAVFSKVGIESSNFNKAFGCFYVVLSSCVIFTFIRPPLRSITLLLFLFFPVTLDFMFNGYRQGVAFLFILSAIFCFNGRRYAYGGLFLIVALGFHWSSLIAIIVLFLQRFIPREKITPLIIILLFVTVISAVIPLGILQFFSGILDSFSQLMPDAPIVKKAVLYINANDMSKSFYGLNMIGRLPLIFNIIVFLGLIIFYRKLIPDVFYKYAVCFMLYSSLLLEMAYSFRNYYWVLPMCPFLMSAIIESSNSNDCRKNRVLLFSLLHLLIVVTGYYTSNIVSMIYM